MDGDTNNFRERRMKFDIYKSLPEKSSFRIEALKGMFDLQTSKVNEHFSGDIEIENIDWNVGVIYGASGTGKSSIAKEIFPDSYIRGFTYRAPSILDDMPIKKTMKEITSMFSSVGFSSPPSWLKPYDVLSEGEKMRVNLARSILEGRDLIVFDEYTSVVNREVAKIGSFALQKSIRKQGKKFIAVACHSDILEWLEPDWTFCTDTMKFEVTRGLLRRPEIKIEIRRCGKEIWEMFRKHHYLNTNLHTASICFVALINSIPVGFTAARPLVHAVNKKNDHYLEHRSVVLPDYQGIGIGVRLSDAIAKLFVSNGGKYFSVTSNPAMIAWRLKNLNWRMSGSGRKASGNKSNNGKTNVDKMKTHSSNRNTTSWEYSNDSIAIR